MSVSVSAVMGVIWNERMTSTWSFGVSILYSAFCLMPVHGGYGGGGDPSGEPFEAEVYVMDFCGCCPCGECHVGAEAPSAVGERAEAADEVVVCVFGFAGEFASEFGEDVTGAG